MSLHNLSALTWKPSFVSQVPGFLRAGSAAARRWGTTIVEDATRANRIAVLLFASAVFFAFSLAAFFFSLPAQRAGGVYKWEYPYGQYGMGLIRLYLDRADQRDPF